MDSRAVQGATVVELAINMGRLVIRLYKEVELNVSLLDSNALVKHVDV